MRLLSLLSVLLLTLLAGTATAQPEDCSTPRSAADMTFHWQQPGIVDLRKAARCLDPTGRAAGKLQQVAQRVKAVYDIRELFVEMESLSDSPDFVNEEGKATVAVHPDLPEVTLQKRGERWLWAAPGLDVVDRLYESEGAPLARLVAQLPTYLQGEIFGVAAWQLLGLALMVILALVLRLIVRLIIASRVRSFAKRTGHEWASNLAGVTAAPVATLSAALALRVSYPLLALPIQTGLLVSGAVRVVVVVSLVWGLYRLVDALSERIAERAEQTETKLDDQLVPLLRKSAKTIVVVGGVLFALQNMNVDVGSLLTGLGIGGLAFALAARETLANFFGSVMIFVDRPFQIGDWIVVKGVEGTVEEVGFRSTRVRTFYNSVISVPNAVFTDAAIDNYGRREYRRTVCTLNLTYDTTPEQMQAFCQGIRAIIVANPHTRKDYYEVHMSGFGAHSLDVMVYYFFKVASWTEELRERHNVYLEVLRLAQELGVEFAFPTQTLLVDELAAAGVPRQSPSAHPAQRLAEVVRAFGPGGKSAQPQGPVIVPGGMVAGVGAAGNDDG